MLIHLQVENLNEDSTLIHSDQLTGYTSTDGAYLQTHLNCKEYTGGPMVIQMQFGNGTEVEKTRNYREVIKNVNLDSYIQGFFAHRDSWKWGRLIQLKGKERITLRTFGKYPNGETQCKVV